MSLFDDRHHAGRQLAEVLADQSLGERPVVLGLARGGIPVAYEVAHELKLPLDVFVVRKLGVPFQPELAFGAIASGEVRILNDDVVNAAGIDGETIARVTAEQRRELQRREAYYRRGRDPVALEDRCVLLVDDGIATGASMMAAIEGLRHQHPQRIVGAIPVAPPRSCKKIARKVDDMVCLRTPDPFGGVGAWYRDFGQTTDDEVRQLLDIAQNQAPTT